MTPLEENFGHLNVLLVESIDETITTLLSREVVDALYLHLQKVHSIPKDQVLYKLETLCSTLEKTFGLLSSRIICKGIARRLFAKLGLTYISNPDRTLLEYVEQAKMKVREKGAQA
jgi:hypothetical protein